MLNDEWNDESREKDDGNERAASKDDGDEDGDDGGGGDEEAIEADERGIPSPFILPPLLQHSAF